MDFDEHRSQVRTASGPRIMASLRNLVITILRLAGAASIAAALSYHARRPARPPTDDHEMLTDLAEAPARRDHRRQPGARPGRHPARRAARQRRARQHPRTRAADRRLLYSDSLAWLTGKRGHGKSFAALDMAGHVSLGQNWHGHATKRGPVLYIAAEGVAGLRQRVRAWETLARSPRRACRQKRRHDLGLLRGRGVPGRSKRRASEDDTGKKHVAPAPPRRQQPECRHELGEPEVRYTVPRWCACVQVISASTTSRVTRQRNTFGRTLTLEFTVNASTIAGGRAPCVSPLPTMDGMCRTDDPGTKVRGC
jgi:hypothetical protein